MAAISKSGLSLRTNAAAQIPLRNYAHFFPRARFGRARHVTLRTTRSRSQPIARALTDAEKRGHESHCHSWTQAIARTSETHFRLTDAPRISVQTQPPRA